jgi:hypothetical protein
MKWTRIIGELMLIVGRLPGVGSDTRETFLLKVISKHCATRRELFRQRRLGPATGTWPVLDLAELTEGCRRVELGRRNVDRNAAGPRALPV